MDEIFIKPTLNLHQLTVIRLHLKGSMNVIRIHQPLTSLSQSSEGGQQPACS